MIASVSSAGRDSRAPRPFCSIVRSHGPQLASFSSRQPPATSMRWNPTLRSASSRPRASAASRISASLAFAKSAVMPPRRSAVAVSVRRISATVSGSLRTNSIAPMICFSSGKTKSLIVPFLYLPAPSGAGASSTSGGTSSTTPSAASIMISP